MLLFAEEIEMSSNQTLIYEDVINEVRGAWSVIRATGVAIGGICSLAEGAVGLLKNAHATSDNNIRDQARQSYNEILSQIDGLITDATFEGYNLLDGKATSQTDEIFNLHINMQGLWPNDFTVEGVNLNTLNGSERLGSEPNRLVDFVQRQNASDYNYNLIGDHLISTDIRLLEEYLAAIREVAQEFKAKEIERYHLDFMINGGLSRHISEEGITTGSFIGSSLGDIINGSVADEQFFGNAGDDFIRGGGGSDIIHGGDGNDTIYYDEADIKTNVTGGDGFDRLVVRTGDGIAPVDFDLLKQGFERANVSQYDQHNESWDEIIYHYNENWQLFAVSVDFDDRSYISERLNDPSGVSSLLAAFLSEPEGLNSLRVRQIVGGSPEPEVCSLIGIDFSGRDSGSGGDIL
jgi:Ca2+-binding RTX toxin-like protein